MSAAVTLVDDCKELRVLVSLLLFEELGVRCTACASFSEVQRREEQVLENQAAIIDINLGAGQPDGVQVYRWFRERGYKGKIFFLTGHAKGSPQLREALQTGVTILEKPMTADELVALLHNLLLRKRNSHAS